MRGQAILILSRAMRAMLIAATVMAVAGVANVAHARESKEERENKKRHKEAETHLAAGLDQMGQGVFDRALEEFQSAEAFEPKPEITQHIGECQEALGQLADAIASYKKYLTDSPGAADGEQVKKHITELEGAAHAENGRKLAEQKKWSEAVPEFQAAIATKPEPKLYYELGNAQENKGDTKGAIETYKLYLKASPDAADAGEIEARIKVLSGEHMAAPPPPPPPPKPPERKPFYTDKLGTGLAAGGILAILGGAIAEGLSSGYQGSRDSAHDEANFLSSQSSAKNASVAGGLLLVVGLAAAIAGGVMIYLHVRLPDDPNANPENRDPNQKFIPQAATDGPFKFAVGESY